jgi:DNA-binding MarR family transcriptional regulator
MSKPPPFNPRLFQDLSTWTLMFHQAVAEQLGLGPTDHKCLGFIADHHAGEGHMTPGLLADLTGLTTGAVTGVIDRLESAGFVRREKDPSDRRQVIVRPVPQRMAEVAALFEPIGRAGERLCAKYSAKELELISGFIQGSIEITKAEALRLRAEKLGSTQATGLSVLRNGLRELTFEAKRGVVALTLGACDEPHLYTAQFGKNAPSLTLQDGKLTYVSPEGGVLDFLKKDKSWGRLGLSREVHWSLRLKGGVSSVDLGLSELSASSFELTGGASHLTLRLGQPRSTVPIRIKGGASDVRIIRPRGAAVKVTAHGGVSGFVIDGLKLGSFGGVARWASPDAETTSDRFEIDLSGGVSGLVLETT